MDAPRFLSPNLELLRQEFVLVQAWKKTSAHIRSHNWYADTLELDLAAVNLPSFLAGLRKQLENPNQWTNSALRIVPAPKSQEWHIAPETKQWEPRPPPKGARKAATKLRPLAHASLADQVVATAVMMCLADRVEALQGDPRTAIDGRTLRKQVISYGNRLFCDNDAGVLSHRWGSSKLYRGYYQDYRRFLSRPDEVAGALDAGSKIVILQSDLRQFYDRVRPTLLSKKLDSLKRPGDDPAFFDFAKRLLDWRWDARDSREIESYATLSNLDGFNAVALPQGLVSAGFFANLALLDFDEALKAAIGLELRPGLCLHDACRYVDDLRLVLTIGPNSDLKEVEKFVSGWLQQQLGEHAPGLEVSPEKTVASMFAGDERALVRQSRKMQRIQRAMSGGFDAIAGEEILEAVQGLMRSQQRFSENSPNKTSWDFSPIPDVRDATVARFAAGRFRSAYRSLRPLLPDSDDTITDGANKSDAPPPSRTPKTQQELDDEARAFALGLIEQWIGDPSNVRLLRIGLDLWPADDVLKNVLSLIRPFTELGGRKKAPRRVAWYCLAEIFRAGATETGFVENDESFPAEIDIKAYRKVLKEEAHRLVSLPNASLPWYLKQQVLLFLAASDAKGAPITRAGSTPETKHYRELILFLRGESERLSFANLSVFSVLSRRSYLNKETATRLIGPSLTTRQLETIAALDPSLAIELLAHKPDFTTQISPRVRDDLSLLPEVVAKKGEYSLAQIVIEQGSESILRNEIELLSFSAQLLEKLPDDLELLTPTDVRLRFPNDGVPAPGSFSVSVSSSRVSPMGSLYQPPGWCLKEERWRFHLGYLLRFILTGHPDFSRPVRQLLWKEGHDIYRSPENHWYQRHHGFFNGHTAFGDDWLPISDWIEKLLSALLHWPGCRPTELLTTVRQSKAATRLAIEERLVAIIARKGELTGTLMLGLQALFPGKDHSTRPLRGCIVQTVIPKLSDFDPTDLTFSQPTIRKRHRNHLAAALSAVERMLDLRETHETRNGRLDWLILPELSVHPDDVKTHLIPFARAHKTIILAGLTYQEIISGKPLVNSALWIIPVWSHDYGLQTLIRRQGKQNLAPAEAAFNSPVTKIREFRPCQWLVGYKWSSSETRPLWLTASVCFDATDIRLAADLRGKSDVYAIPALNKDIGTFDQMAQALHYHMYQMVVVANNGTFGGSNAYAPYKDQFRKQVFHLHGQPQASIAFFEIDDVRAFIERGANDAATSSVDSTNSSGPVWKAPPAGHKV
jgi:hypothetical protein